MSDISEFNLELDTDNEDIELDSHSSSEGELENTSQQDLGYHEYTGNSLKAKHASEMVGEYKSADLGSSGFRERARDMALFRISREESALIREQNDVESEISGITTGTSYNEQIDNADQQLENLTNQIAEDENAEATDINTIKLYNSQRIDLSTKIIRIEEDLYNLNQKLKKATLKETSEKLKLDALLEEQKSLNESGAWAIRKALMNRRVKSQMAKVENRKAACDKLKNKIDGLSSALDSLKTESNHLATELAGFRADLNARKEHRKAAMSERDVINTDYGEKIKNASWLTQLKKLRKDRKNIANELNSIKDRKADIDKDALQSDYASYKGAGKGKEFRAIMIDGRNYYDNPGGKDIVVVDSKDADAQNETQKIVKQIRSREIFKYLNSDNISEYMAYNDANAIFEMKNGEETQEEYDMRMRKLLFPDDMMLKKNQGDNYSATKDFFGGIGTAFKDLGSFGIDTVIDLFQLDEVYNAIKGNTDAKGSQGALESKKELVESLTTWGSIPISMIPGTKLTSVDGLYEGGLELLGQSLLNKSVDISAMGLVGDALSTGLFLKRAGEEVTKLSRKQNQKKLFKAQNLNRFARVMQNGAVENKVNALSNYADAGASVLGTVSKFTGLAGLLVTGVNLGLKIAIKQIGSAVIHSKNKKDILNSPQVLGGIIDKYDKKLIKPKYFENLFTSVTGVNGTSELVDVIKIVDAIDLHQSASKVATTGIHDVAVESSMRELGFTEPRMFRRLRVKDILNKTGVSLKKNWRSSLRNAIEIAGVDYETRHTKFMKGLTRNKDRYKEKSKRLTREEITAMRRGKKG